MDLWIPVTVAAAFSQNLRTALQKHLTERLTVLGASYARFALGLPFALAYLWVVSSHASHPLPGWTAEFVLYGIVGGLSQILATALLLDTFRYRNFAVGTTYSKTETVQTALVGVVVLGELLSVAAGLGILVSLAGVVAISVAKSGLTARNVLLGWTVKPALMGLAAGGFFGISAVSYRAASLSLDGGGFALRAALTLAAVLAFQTIAMTIYMTIKEPRQILPVFQHWRWTGLVGLVGMLGSACWFTAMTLQNAAYVRALGQVELVFTIAVSALVFRERIAGIELAGIALVVAGIVLVLMG